MVDAGVAVAVGDEDLSGQRRAGRRYAHVRRVIERGLQLRSVPISQGHHQLSLGCVLQYLMGVTVGQVNPVVRANVNQVGIGGHPVLSGPLRNHVSIAVEDQHRRVAPLEYVQIVVRVYGHGAWSLKLHPRGKFGPVRPVLVPVVTRSDHDRHIFSSVGACARE